MKHTLTVTISFVLAFCISTSFAATPKEENPIFKSSLPWLKTPVALADSEAKTAQEMKAYEETIPGTDQKFKMIPIPGGKFTMGGPRAEETAEKVRNKSVVSLGVEIPSVEVEIQPFWMEEHEATWKEFSQYGLKWLRNKSDAGAKDDRTTNADAMAWPTNPWDISSISYNNSSKDHFPASGMTQYAAAAYCKWLTYKTGRYYRLPTEAEWEYACRAGSKDAFSFGDDAEKLGDYAWFFDNVESGYQKIMTRKPNKFGLFDMHGNVAEWTISQYSKDSYEKLAKGDFPLMFIRPEGEYGQIARGGSCDDEAGECQSSTRKVFNQTWKSQDPQIPKSIWWVTNAPFVGFRVVRPLNPPATDQEAAQYEPNPLVWKEYSELNTRE